MAPTGPQQELASLRAGQAQFTKEKEKLAEEIAEWKAKISQKNEIIAKLQLTVAELQKPDGKREGLLRCAAEYGKPDPQPQAEGAASARAIGPSKEEIDLGCRVASAVAAGPNAELTFGWSDEDFAREFADDGNVQLQQFLGRLSSEQRLFWELQNPPEHSFRVDRQLLGELRKAGRKQEIDLLVSAVGPPTCRERQYRPLLWLQRHRDLDVSYAEASAMSTSLLTLACQAGFADVTRELIARKADLHQVSKDNSTALFAACRVRSWECVRLLLEGRADPNETVGGCSVLARAVALTSAKKGQPLQGQQSLDPAVSLLLEFAADPNGRGGQGRTALMLAAARGEAKTCEALLAARADPAVKESEGNRTASELAIENQHFSLAEWLDTAS